MKLTDKIEITNEDNMVMMSRYPDKYFDLAIVDPPYGTGVNIMNITATPSKRKNKRVAKKENKDWDISPKKEYFDELFRVSKNQIIWGANYYDHLNGSRCWIFWDKLYENTFNFSAGELAWTSFNYPMQKVTISNRIMPHQSLTHFHPTSKPIKLYKWLLEKFAKQGDKILDTHLGSGSIAIACHDYGFELTACELDKEYFDKAIERIKNHISQQKLF